MIAGFENNISRFLQITQSALVEETKEVLSPFLTVKRFRSGHLLWREGDADGMLTIIISGKVKIYRLLPNGKAVTLYIFSDGDIFGFMPFFDGSPYPAFAQVLEETEVQVISRSSLINVIHQNPEIALILIKLLSQRLRGSFDQIERISSRGTLPKVASSLLAIVPEKKKNNNVTIITLPVSSAEFASSIGISPETFSRNITELVNKKIIHRLRPNKFQILEVEQLRKIAGFIFC